MDDLQNIPIVLRSYAYTLVPCSMWPTFLCCVMYDGHPRNEKKIDITICLQGGKVLELFQRECVSSIRISDASNIKDIQIIRNNNGQLFYLVVTDHEVITLLSTDQLSIHRRFYNVIHYELCDPECSGEAKLMIKTESSTSFISFDDVKNVSQNLSKNLDCTKPVISALAKKLTEANYNLDCNKKAYKQIEKLRQHASFLCHEEGAMELKTSKPVVTFCNKKIVIQLEVENSSSESINKVFVLIHNNSCNSISYTSKVYEHLPTSPFYKEIKFREIKSNRKASIVAVIPIREFKSSISCRIDFSVIISYERQKKNYLQSLDDVHISAGEVMGKNFDVFNSPEVDERSMCLAMLSTTVKTSLCLKQKGLGDMISLSEIFCKYLEMHLLVDRKMAIHKQSPHHILHGMLIIFDDDNENIDVIRNEINCHIDVYSRSSSQIMALIHFINDKVPLSLIVTTPNIQVRTSDGDADEDTGDRKLLYNYNQCANSLLNQCSMTLEYLDNCLNDMNKSNNMDKTDIKIDLFATGREEFVQYKNNMLAEAENCFEQLVKSAQTCSLEEVMELD